MSNVGQLSTRMHTYVLYEFSVLAYVPGKLHECVRVFFRANCTKKGYGANDL